MHLELFTKFSSPKSLHREAELRNLYDQVLKSDQHCSEMSFVNTCVMMVKGRLSLFFTASVSQKRPSTKDGVQLHHDVQTQIPGALQVSACVVCRFVFFITN